MPGTRTTPEEKAQVMSMRCAGYSLAVISARTSLSVRTVSRIVASAQAKPEPISRELYERARDGLVNSLASDESLRRAIASSIADDLELCSRIREKAASSIELIEIKSADDARVYARTLAQLSQAIKATQFVARKALHADEQNSDDGVTILEVREMTADEVEEVRRHASTGTAHSADLE